MFHVEHPPDLAHTGCFTWNTRFMATRKLRTGVKPPDACSGVDTGPDTHRYARGPCTRRCPCANLPHRSGRV